MTGSLKGVYLPIITPFSDGSVDLSSYSNLLEYYIDAGISGVIPVGTTGEAPVIEEDELDAIVGSTVEVVRGRISVLIGVSSNSTHKAEKTIEKLSGYSVDGFLVTAPYYNLPSQEGIYEHYVRLANATDKPIVIYNIPYRTGRNIENETVFRLSALENIVGIKDSCGNVRQTMELIRTSREDFSVLTGEDHLFYFNIVSGGNGGILASAHLQTRLFIEVFSLVQANDHRSAVELWNRAAGFVPLLFREPNPGPVKYVLWRKGLIASPELRLPMTGISAELKQALDGLIEDGTL